MAREYYESQLAMHLRAMTADREEYVDERPEHLQFSRDVSVADDVADGSPGSLVRLIESLQATLALVPEDLRAKASIKVSAYDDDPHWMAEYPIEETEAAYTARQRKVALRREKELAKAEARERTMLANLKAKYGE